MAQTKKSEGPGPPAITSASDWSNKLAGRIEKAMRSGKVRGRSIADENTLMHLTIAQVIMEIQQECLGIDREILHSLYNRNEDEWAELQADRQELLRARVLFPNGIVTGKLPNGIKLLIDELNHWKSQKDTQDRDAALALVSKAEDIVYGFRAFFNWVLLVSDDASAERFALLELD